MLLLWMTSLFRKAPHFLLHIEVSKSRVSIYLKALKVLMFKVTLYMYLVCIGLGHNASTGISPLTKSACTFLVSFPPHSH